METLEETRARIRAKVSGPGKTSRWILAHLDHVEMDWCLIWPFRWEEGAYPKAGVRPAFVVHRLMCEYRHGIAPSPRHHSAHSCNRGVHGCCNPMHVSWKTASENQKDRYRDSGLTSRTKLTPEDVDKIRLLDGRAKPSDMAKQFGVSLRNIRLILAGETWKSDPVGRRIFTPEEVLSILGRPEVTAVALASEFHATKSQIDRIRHRKSYRWVDVGTATTPS